MIFDSVILCLFTTFDSKDIDTRVLIKANKQNGLIKDSYVMTDKIITVDKKILGTLIGEVSKDDMKKNIQATISNSRTIKTSNYYLEVFY